MHSSQSLSPKKATTQIALWVFIALIFLSIQPASGGLMTIDVSQEKERQLKNWLGLYDIPDNASQYLLTRINLEALKKTAAESDNDAANPEVGVRVVSIDSLIATGPQTIFSVGKQPLTLIYENLEYTAAGGLMMHWLGHVQGDPDSFVRLTFEGNSIIGDVAEGSSYAQMSGTIFTNGKIIKLRPAGFYDYHILYEVKDGDPHYLLQLNNELIDETKARWLEAKGIQRDLLAEMPESSFSIGIRGSLTSLRGDLSHGKLGELEVRTRNDLKQAVEVLAPYYGFTGSEEFTLHNQFPLGDKYFYDLSETINGMAVHRSNLRIIVSKNNHKFIRVIGPAFVDSGFSTIPFMTEDEAKKLALEHMTTWREGEFVGLEATEAMLVYGQTETSESELLRLNWAIVVLTPGLPIQTLVDTVSGKVRVLLIIDD